MRALCVFEMTFEIKSIEWIQGYLEGIGAVSTVYGRDVNADFSLVEITSGDSPYQTILSLNKDWEGRYLEEINYRITKIENGIRGFQAQIEETMRSFQFDILNDVAEVTNQSYKFLEKSLESSHAKKIDFLSISFCGYLEHHIEKNSEYYHFFLENYTKKKDTPSQYGFGNIGEEFLIYGKNKSFYVGLLLPD